ncbi:MAG: HAD family hydrolase [Candidatus Pacearchaeota archaeon]|jgi:FMN phosphatase YigB (HAD superfamily)
MKKIIFDLDDTLYVDKDLRQRRENEILKFLEDKKAEYIKLKGNGKGTIESFKLMGFSREDFFKVMENVNMDLIKDIKLIKILNELKKKYKIYVLSNSSKRVVEKTLLQIGILEIVDKYYYGESFSNEKPAEECFFMVERGDICVGNSFRKDLEIPKNRGAVTILIGKEDLDADFSVENIYEITKILISME